MLMGEAGDGASKFTLDHDHVAVEERSRDISADVPDAMIV